MRRTPELLLEDTRALIRDLETQAFTPLQHPLHITAYTSPEPLSFEARCTGQGLDDLRVGDTWGQRFDCAWFHITRLPPPTPRHVLLVDLGGEALVVDPRGRPLRGLTNCASTFDRTLGEPGKRVTPLPPERELWIDAGANDLFGELQHQGRIQTLTVALHHPERLALHHDLTLLLDLLEQLPPHTARARRIAHALHTVTATTRPFTPEHIAHARATLKPLLAHTSPNHPLTLHAIGHAHLDLAWLWPLRETRRKNVRTFATALELLQRYPDWVFGVSQAQLFDWLREDAPSLFERAQTQLARKRIEPLGCMWVEPDANLPSGESLIRQIVWGARAFHVLTGEHPRHAFLPDTFGFSPCLPQLLRQAGVTAFITQKLSWNTHNPFPWHAFRWCGIDGSTVNVHMLPEHTYNSPALPRSAARIEKHYEAAHVSAHALLVFGIGDGGGGPGPEHLERLRRLRSLYPLPRVQPGRVQDFLDLWEQDAAHFPEWRGELYLERHQGTFTTRAALKHANRSIEHRLFVLEALLAIHHLRTGEPPLSLETLWKRVLLLQFHDILPGTCIQRVADEALDEYVALGAEIEALIAQHESELHISPRLIGGPASQKPSGHLAATLHRLENDHLIVELNDAGQLLHLTWHGEEHLRGPGNLLQVFHDAGDAWDFELDAGAPQTLRRVDARACVEDGVAMIWQRFEHGVSWLEQTLRLEAGSSRLDLVCHAHWVRPASRLEVHLPTDIESPHACFEIALGHVVRPTHSNTSWERARNDVPAHRWSALTDGERGLALLNDSRYGHRAEGHTLGLTLLRNVSIPNEEEHFTDMGEHHFTYALLPFTPEPGFVAVRDAAWALHAPSRAVVDSPPLITLDDPCVRISAFKPADSGDAVVLRLFECSGAARSAVLQLGFDVQLVQRCDLLEVPVANISHADREVRLKFGPFEVVTLRLVTL